MARPPSPLQHQTRERLLTVGLATIWAEGYHATGLQEILKAAQVPKGSFYHYFSSKEAFVSALVQRYAAEMTSVRRTLLAPTARPALERIRQHFSQMAEEFVGRNLKQGCLLGNLSEEVADHSEPLRGHLQAAFREWQNDLSAVLSEAVAAGELPATTNTEAVAAFLLNSWEGAILRMRVEHSREPLDLFLELGLAQILRN